MSFEPGHIISFICKDGSFGTAKVLRIDKPEDLPVSAPVYHLLIHREKHITPPLCNSITLTPYISHLPITNQGIERSGCSLVDTNVVKLNEEELLAYDIWKEAFFSGEAGIFDLTIEEAIGIIMDANQS